MTRILVVGGYGAFGARIAERLARERDLDLVIAGRDENRAREGANALRRFAKARIGHRVLDARKVTAAALAADGPAGSVVIDASGPFQSSDYSLARAAIGARHHYIDLADQRPFVSGIATLDSEARRAGVLVVSGASSVPGLSSAVVEDLSAHFASMHAVDIGISPGNSFDPGVATTESVLSGIGRPLTIRIDGTARQVFGWQGLHRHTFSGLGRRWLGHVDVPDLELLAERYPALSRVTFRAGVEVAPMHLGLWALSWLVRAGLLRRPERLARPLLSLKRRLAWLGSDAGGMFVTVAGQDRNGRHRVLEWSLVARSGHGPYVPAMSSVILAKRLARGIEKRKGAMACMALFPLTDLAAETADLDITCRIDDVI